MLETTNLLASRRECHDDDQISSVVCVRARFQSDLLNAIRDVHELRSRFKCPALPTQTLEQRLNCVRRWQTSIRRFAMQHTHTRRHADRVTTRLYTTDRVVGLAPMRADVLRKKSLIACVRPVCERADRVCVRHNSVAAARITADFHAKHAHEMA